MTTKEREIVLADLRADRSPVDWLAWTDGSGHTDMFGGYGSVVARLKPQMGKALPIQRASGAMHGTTVNRAEFTGLLEALQLIHTTEMKCRAAGSSLYPVVPVRARWYTDRENLALGVALNPETGQPYYDRHIDHDLWARYDWYAKSIIVRPVHVARNKLAMQAKCDYVASYGRKAYISWIQHITKKSKWIQPSST